MTTEEGLLALLAGNAGITAIAGESIFPGMLPEEPTYPAVTCLRISTPEEHTLDGKPSLADPKFQIGCWARTYSQAKQLAAAVRALLDGFIGALGAGGPACQGALIVDHRDYFESEPRVWNMQLDVTLQVVE